MLHILAGLLYHHGHKTVVSWIVSGVIITLALSLRFLRIYRRRSRRD